MIRQKRQQPEFKLSCVVADYLRLALPESVVWWHTPNGEYRTEATGKRLKRMGVLPGVSDYVFLFEGRPYFIELKATKGRLSDNQERFMERCALQNIAFAVCKSSEEVEKILRYWGFPLKATQSPYTLELEMV